VGNTVTVVHGGITSPRLQEKLFLPGYARANALFFGGIMRLDGSSENLLGELRSAAVRRGLLQADAGLDVAAVFALVREMPYLRASNREPLTTIGEWRGTCSGKHYLLLALLQELGHDVTLIACTTYVAAELAENLPAELQQLMAEGPVPDVHNYLKLRSAAGLQVVDATWPLDAARYGLPVNPEFVWGKDMLLPCTPLVEFEVPAGVDAQDFKDELLARHFTPAEVERRRRFFTAIAG
jgi:hypothetical protein